MFRSKVAAPAAKVSNVKSNPPRRNPLMSPDARKRVFVIPDRAAKYMSVVIGLALVKLYADGFQNRPQLGPFNREEWIKQQFDNLDEVEARLSDTYTLSDWINRCFVLPFYKLTHPHYLQRDKLLQSLTNDEPKPTKRYTLWDWYIEAIVFPIWKLTMAPSKQQPQQVTDKEPERKEKSTSV